MSEVGGILVGKNRAKTGFCGFLIRYKCQIQKKAQTPKFFLQLRKMRPYNHTAVLITYSYLVNELK